MAAGLEMSTQGFEKAGLDALWEAVIVALAFHESDDLCVCVVWVGGVSNIYSFLSSQYSDILKVCKCMNCAEPCKVEVAEGRRHPEQRDQRLECFQSRARGPTLPAAQGHRLADQRGNSGNQSRT